VRVTTTPRVPVALRRVRYQVAASLDEYIAGPNGEADWIVADPDIDFGSIFAPCDTALMGRSTFLAMVRLGRVELPGLKTIVFSRTLRARDYPRVAVVADRAEDVVPALRRKEGKDIWLFGGGALFKSLLAAGLVDTVEVAIVPVLLGGGVPLLPPPADRAKLKLQSHRIYPRSGIVSLEYAVGDAG
jgi:dihydrofolate reductase